MKKKYALRPDKDYETEPDYGVTLKCIYCDMHEAISGRHAEEHAIDDSNFVCTQCRYLVD